VYKNAWIFELADVLLTSSTRGVRSLSFSFYPSFTNRRSRDLSGFGGRITILDKQLRG